MTAFEMRISDWSSDVCSSDLKSDRPVNAALPLEAWAEIERLNDIALIVHLPRAQYRRVADIFLGDAGHASSEARRVGDECVRTCRSRWSPYTDKKNNMAGRSASIRCDRSSMHIKKTKT